MSCFSASIFGPVRERNKFFNEFPAEKLALLQILGSGATVLGDDRRCCP
jgi:hypothetical protein